MNRFATALLFVLAAATFNPAPAFPLCVEPGKPAPEVTLPSIDGKYVALGSFKGKIVLMAFWASWCPRCEEELKYLEGIYRQSDDIVVLAVNQESQNISSAHVERIRKTLSEWKIDFPVLLDRNLEAWDAFCINALPTSIIVDGKGIVQYAEANYYWATQDRISEVIREIREKRK